MRLRLLCAVVAGLLVACEREKPAGPPEKLGLTGAYGSDTALEVRAALFDARTNTVRPEGTVRYTLYAGPPSKGVVLCTASGPLTKASYTVPEGVEYTFAVNVTFPEPCRPLPGDVRYGMVSFRSTSGATVSNVEHSFVPMALGGSGNFNFPKFYESDLAEEKKRGEAAGRSGELSRKLRELGALAASGAPALGQACPPLKEKAKVLRADQRLLAGLDATIDESAFQAVNDEAARGMVRGSKAVPEALDYVEVVRVDRLEPPQITDRGYRDGKKGTGWFRPGVMAGEVWVVDVSTGKILCRAAVTASNTEDVEGKSAEVDAKLERDFVEQVGSQINRAARGVAPELPNTWP